MRSVVKLFITVCTPVLLCAVFSMRVDAAVFIVNSTGNDGDANTADGICQTATPGECTLRAAIDQANVTPGIDTINFVILPGGQQNLSLTQTPFITEAVTIDATTQPGFNPVTNVPLIVLTASTTGLGRAFTFQHSTGASLVRGFVLNGWDVGVRILNSGTASVKVAGNYIGVDPSGTTYAANNTGIWVLGAPNNIIGGSTVADRNVIAGNFYGLLISNAGATNNTVIGNYIGTNAAGTAPLLNFFGVSIGDASNNTIGGTTAADRNVISGNTYGVQIERFMAPTTNNIVKGNYIGTDASGTAALGNAYGVGISSADVGAALDSIIGGVGPGEANTIAFNTYGVIVSSGTGNAIRGNSIFSNTNLGIDLHQDGVTANDTLDPDPGANNRQNFPVLTYDATLHAVIATLNSTASTTFNIDFYSNPANERQGKKYLGTRQITTDGSGNGSVGATFSQEVPAGHYVTATATRAAAPLDTSEFAAQLLLAAPTAADANISGDITGVDGAGIAGITVSLAGTQTRKTITDAAGNYHFDNVETGGFYTVTPTRVSYSFGPASRSFSQVGNATEAKFTATPNSLPGDNAIDTAEYFVRQHYLDFLGREPDEDGFNFWSDQILECGADAGCVERRRINVSAAYYLSVEFQQTGGLVDGLYRTSYGLRPKFAEFMPDTRAVARDVVVGRQGWQAKLEANKQAFVDAFVQRPAFREEFDGLSSSDFVDALISHARVTFTSGEREALVTGLASGTLTRAAVLRSIAEDERFVAAKFNEAFVMMQYFGYLRRDPDESGYAFWLNKLSEFNGNFERAEMVKAFIVSGEYRARFRP